MSRETKALFITSRRLHPKFSSLSFGKYTIEPIPSADTGNTNATNQYLLRFPDQMGESDFRSTPTREAELMLSLLSLWLGTRLEVKSLMVNSLNAGALRQDVAASGITGILENPPDLQLLIDKFNSLDLDLARQFLRAADVYKTAVNLIGQNNTLAYFLLTVTIECLSNKIRPETGKGKCDNFINFILAYLQDKSQIESEAEWKELLKEVYYRHRSGFTHGGKEIPQATDLADQLNRVYVKNFIDGKEVKTPSLKWFEAVVRNTLLGFLIAQETSKEPKDTVKEISLEHGVVHLKAMRDIAAGSIVTDKDLDLD
jgi:hypothetical protein